MKIKHLLLFAMLLPCITTYAQTDFRSGYVITLEGDSLWGEINYRGDRFLAAECTFRQQEGKPTIYRPEDISAYRYEGDRFFVSKNVEGKAVFLEYLINGKLDVFYMCDKENTNH
jgi:hypothetical protein